LTPPAGLRTVVGVTDGRGRDAVAHRLHGARRAAL